MTKAIINISNICFYLVLGLVLTRCASVSTIQTARVLAPEKEQHAFGGGMYSSQDKTASGVDFSSSFLEYSYRRGWIDKVDYGLRITLIGTGLADIKYNLINDEKLAVAVGGGLGYMSISSGTGDSKTETQIYDFNFPLYASYDFNELVSVYTSPKFIIRYSTSESESASETLMAATLGVKVGKEKGVLLEATGFQSTNNQLSGSQVNGMFFMNL